MADQSIFVDNVPFLGRIEEQKQFRVALRDLLHPDPSEELPYIFLLYGDGGMGKTTLAKCFRGIAEIEQPFEGAFQTLWIDWEDERNRSAELQIGRDHVSPETVFKTLYGAAERNKWGRNFGNYQKKLSLRSAAEKKAVESISKHDTTDEFSPLRGASASLLAKFIRAGIPVIGDAGEQFSQVLLDNTIRVGAQEAAKLRSALENRLKANLKAEQYNILLNPHEQLAEALADGLKKTAAGKPLLVFFDTYEIVDRADAQLRLIMHEAGPRIMWVVSGRTDLVKGHRTETGYFKGYADEFSRRLLAYDMRQLAIDDIRNYFRYRVPQRLLTETDVEAISQTTRGIPLAIREAADIWQSGVPLASLIGNVNERTPRDQIVRKMTERYLLHVVSAEDKVSLYALALARGNIEILRSMLSQTENQNSLDLEALLHRLERDYASVHAERARLHDAPAHFFREYLRAEIRRTGEPVRALNQRAVLALREQIRQLEENLPSVEERSENEDWVRAVLDLTYHLFWLDENEAWRWSIARFVEGLGYSLGLRRGLLQVIRRWKDKMSRTGQKRLNSLFPNEQMPVSSSDNAEMLNELERLAQKGWLVGDNEKECLAILNIRRGELLATLDRFVEALAYFEQAERQLPEKCLTLRDRLGELLSHLGLDLVKANKPKEALVASQLSIIVDKQNADVHHRLAHVYLDLQREDDAIVEFKTAIEIEPLDSNNYVCLGRAYSSAGHHQDAQKALEHAINLDPKDAAAHYGLGNVYRDLGYINEANYQRAIIEYRRAIDLDPKLAAPHNGLGRAYQELGQTGEAIAAYQRAIDLNPKFVAPYDNLGDLYADLGRTDEAIIEYQKSIKLDPKYPYPHNALGNLYQDLGRMNEAMTSYLHAIELDPKYAAPHNNVGTVYRSLGQVEDAVKEYQNAIALDPGNTFYRYGLALAYRDGRFFGKAINTCREILELNVNDVRGHNGLGYLYIQTGDLINAEIHLLRALEISPQSSLTFLNLGIVRWRNGEIESAKNCFKAALDSVSDGDNATTGWLQVGIGEIEKGFANIREALQERDPSDVYDLIDWTNALTIAPNAPAELKQVKPIIYDALRSDPRFLALVGEADEKPTADS